jgi:membrane fusion protein, multidrug efflux system
MNDASFGKAQTVESAQPSRSSGFLGWRRRRWIWIGGLIVVVAGIAVAAWLRSYSAAAPSPSRSGARPTPVAAQAAATGDIDVSLSALGTVIPRNTVTVRARVDGQLLRLNFREGQMVQAGDLIAEIDSRPFEVQLEQAQGQLARDQALLTNARRDLERYNTLFAQDSISKQQRDTQESLVGQYEGAIKSDQGQVDNARLQLSYCRVTAPIAGRAGLRQVDPGNIVRATDQNGLVVITQLQPITVTFGLPEDSVPQVTRRLHTGATPVVEAYARNQQTRLATGRLIAIDNQIDTATGTVKLKGEFANRDGALFPNQFVNVRIVVDVRHGATTIPSAAIQRGAQGTFVFVVQDDRTVTVRPVKVGPVQGEVAAIENGIVPGEIVVVDGLDKLREGGKVEVITRGSNGVAPGKTGVDRPANANKPRRRGGAKQAS